MNLFWKSNLIHHIKGSQTTIHCNSNATTVVMNLFRKATCSFTERDPLKLGRSKILIERKVFFNICQKCVIWSQKTCCGCQGNLKFCTDANYVVLKKTPQNNFFPWAQQHGQNGIWNLEIFVEFFHRQKIFGVLIWGLCSTCPHNFIYPACRMLELQLIYWQFLLLQ